MLKIIKKKNQYFAKINDLYFEAFVGKNGLIDSRLKREGDRSTPWGIFSFGDLYYRPDRLNMIELNIVENTPFRHHQITQTCGWSDDPKDTDYNRYVTLPHAFSHEKLWMNSCVYDAFLVIRYNMDKILPGKGSAIFMHIIEPEIPYTAGCVAFERESFFEVLKNIDQDTQIQIGDHL